MFINITNSFEIVDEISKGKADIGLSRVIPLRTTLKVETLHEERVILMGASISREGKNIGES